MSDPERAEWTPPRGLWNAIKQRAKPAAVAVLAHERVATAALRLAYFARFHSWCRRHARPAVASRAALHDRVRELVEPGPIDYLEFGVFRGESLRWWTGGHRDPASRFYGFDSFQGLPEDWSSLAPRGMFSTGGQLPDIDDVRCQLIAGWFSTTLPAFLADHRLLRRTVVHLDADLFSSTSYVLQTLDPHLKDGDVLIFDEFQDYLDEFRAFELWRACSRLRTEVLVQHGGFTQVAFRLMV